MQRTTLGAAPHGTIEFWRATRPRIRAPIGCGDETYPSSDRLTGAELAFIEITTRSEKTGLKRFTGTPVHRGHS